MNKIIRANGILTDDAYELMKDIKRNKNVITLYTKSIDLKIRNKEDTNLSAFLEQTYKITKYNFSIKYNDETILKKSCAFIEDIIGLTVIKKSQYTLLINIERENIKDKAAYYINKIKSLRYRINCWEEDLMIEEIYNQIIYCDFNNEDELLIATYCIFLIIYYDCQYIEILNLYEQKKVKLYRM